MDELVRRLRYQAQLFERDAAGSAGHAIAAIPTGWGESVIFGWSEHAAHLAGRALDLAQAADTITGLAADLAVWKQTAENLSAQNDALRELATAADLREHAADAKSTRLAEALEGLVEAVVDMDDEGRVKDSDAMQAARAALREVGRG